MDVSLDFDSYRTIVNETCVPLEMRTPNAEAFRGEIGIVDAGDIHVLRVRANEHSVARTPAHAARAMRGALKLTLIERGSAIIVQDGREAVMSAGDIALYDADRPYSFLFGQNTQMSVLLFPRGMLTTPEPHMRTVTGRVLDRHPDLSRMVGPFLRRLASNGNDFASRESRRLSRLAVDMTGALIDANIVSGDMSVNNNARLQRIIEYIEDHLDSPDLDPAQIAAAHFISLRALHAMFAQHGTTVATVMRTRRLERCYDALIDPRCADRSIATIATENGFVASAHFSRAFRARYSCSPSEVRNGR